MYGKQLERFTLESVIAEATQWLDDGISSFARQVKSHGLGPPGRDSTGEEKSMLDRLVLAADH